VSELEEGEVARLAEALARVLDAGPARQYV
jgi:hypothetical protein